MKIEVYYKNGDQDIFDTDTLTESGSINQGTSNKAVMSKIHLSWGEFMKEECPSHLNLYAYYYRKNIVDKFEMVYELDVNVFNEAIHYYEKEDKLAEEVTDMAKIKILNLIVKATREEMKEEYVNELLEIQRLMSVK